MGKPFGGKSEEKGSNTKGGAGKYPYATEEEAKSSLVAAKKDLSPEEYAKLLARICKKHPKLDACAKARNAGMNDRIRAGFGRNTTSGKEGK